MPEGCPHWDGLECTRDEGRWICQLNKFYLEIVMNPDIPVKNLDKANKIICEAIEKLRPLTKKTH